MKNEPVSARLARTKRSPSAIEANTPGSTSWAARSARFGSWDESRKAAPIIARQLAASTTYAAPIPSAPIRMPPNAGPITIVRLCRPKLSASAPRS